MSADGDMLAVTVINKVVGLSNYQASRFLINSTDAQPSVPYFFLSAGNNYQRIQMNITRIDSTHVFIEYDSSRYSGGFPASQLAFNEDSITVDDLDTQPNLLIVQGYSTLSASPATIQCVQLLVILNKI